MRLNSLHQKARLTAASAIDQLRNILAKSADGTVTHQLDLGELEDRILLSASPVAVVVESLAAGDSAETTAPLEMKSDSLFETVQLATPAASSGEGELTSEADQGFLALDSALDESVVQTSAPIEKVATEVVFIDQAAADFEQLVADLQAQRDAGRAVDFFVLGSHTDGVDQIAETLEQYSDLDAVHIVSHGSDGAVKLGGTWLRIGSLDGYAGAIAGWGSAFSSSGDLLFYGCDLASNTRGEMLVHSVAALTGADVAASTDDTGHAFFGGDWDLEFTVGTIEADIAVTEELQHSWAHLLNVTVDATSTGTAPTGASSDTVSHTTTGTDRLMLVGISFGQDKGDTVSSVTYNGTNLTLVGTQDNSVSLGSRMEIWSLVAPDVGTSDVVVNFSGTNHIGATIGVMTFNGVDQATALGSFASSEGDSTTPSTTVSSATGELVFGVLAADHNADIDLVPGAGQTEHWDLFRDKATGGGTTEAGATSVDTSWTLPLARKWAAGGVSIKPSQAGSGLIAYEPFDYVAGSLEGQNAGTGFATAWTTTGGTSAVVNATGLADPTATLPVQGGTAEMSTSSIFTQNRNLTTTLGTDGTTSWFSFLVKPDGVSFGGISLEIGDGAGAKDTVTVGTNSNDFLITRNGSTTGAAFINDVLVDAQTYLLTVKIDFVAGADTVTLYVDPTPGLSNPDSVLTTQLATADLGTFTQVGMIGGFSGNNSNVDEIRVGTSFAAVTPSAATNQPPTLDLDADNSSGATGSGFNANFVDGGGPIAVVDIDATLTDLNDTDLQSLTITITDRQDGGDEILTANTSGTSIVSGFSAGVLTLSGTDTVENYQQILRTVTYNNDQDPATGSSRTITFVANDGVVNSNIGTTSMSVNGVSNQAPTADAGGPYVINEGDSLNLVASASSDPDSDPLTYRWDLDNDGNYGEVGEPTTETPTVNWTTLKGFGIDDNGVYTIGLQVDDGNGGINTTTTTVTVNNTAPMLSTTGSGTASAGSSYTLNLSASDDGDDTISSWTINWGDGSIETFAGNPASVAHTYSAEGFTFNILASAIDEDGTYFQNELLVASSNSDSLLRYGTDGGFLQEFGIPPDAETPDYPVGTIIGPDGKLYVSGWISSDVLRYDATTGAFIDEFVTAGSNGLNSAAGIGFGPDGHLYVASRLTSEVLRFDGSTGAFIDVFVTAGSGGLDEAEGLIFGPDGDLYVSDYQNSAVYKYDGTTGAFGSVFVSAGSGGLNKPENLTFGPDGNLYVADDSGSSVRRYDGTNGAFIDVFVAAGSGGLSFATGVGFGPDGNLYVGSWGTDSVLRYDGTTGAFIDSYISSGSGGLDETDYFAFVPEHQVSVTAIPNSPPTADAGGPYTVSIGNPVNLNASGSSDPDTDPLTYAWDLDNDLVYGEAGEPTTVSPTVSWATLQSFGITGEGAFTIGLQVDDGNGGTDTATTTLNVYAEQLVNTTTANVQQKSDVATDTTGNHVVVWQDDTLDGDGTGVFAQRYDSAGATVGAEFQVNTTTVGNQSDPRVAMDDAGNFVVTWSSEGQDGDPASETNIYARIYDAAGSPVTGEFLVNTITLDNQATPAIAMDGPTGEFMITWASFDPVAGDWNILARRFDVAGTPLEADRVVNQSLPGDQVAPDISVDEFAAFTIVWTGFGQDGDGATEGNIYGQNFKTGGARQGGEILINATTTGHQHSAAIAKEADGDYTIVWVSEGQDGDGAGIFGESIAFGGSGNNRLGEFAINGITTGEQTRPDITGEPHGNFIVAWESTGQDGDGPAETNIYSRVFTVTNAAITPNAPEFLVNTLTTSNQRLPAIAADHEGDYVVAWSGNGPNDADGVFARLYSAVLTNTAPDISLVNPSLSYTENDPPLIIDASLTISDPDNLNLTAATVSFRDGFAVGQDLLSFTPVAGITGTYDASAGILSFSGSASVAAYEAILRTVTYENSSDTPSTVQRQVEFSVDDGVSSSSDVRKINVSATNDAPTANAGGAYAVNEGASIGLDGTASNDADGTITLYEWDLDYDGVTFNGTTTGVTPTFNAATIDGPANRTVALRVTDNVGAISAVVTSTVSINNVAPTATTDTGAAFTTTEDSTFTTGNVLTNDTDPSPIDVLSVTSLDITGTVGLVTDNGDGTFNYDPNGQFESLRQGQQTTDTFSYTVSDDDGGSDTAVVTVTINGANDAPTDITLNNAMVTENLTGAVVGNLATVDPDASDTHVYSVSDTRFEIVGAQLKLKAGQSLDFETEPNATLNITSTDSGSAMFVKAFNLTVVDVNDTAPVIDSGQSFDIPEDLADGASVGTITASDDDTTGEPRQNWMITGGDPAGVFAINAATGQITVADNSTIDFDTPPASYALSVTTSDGTNTSAAETVTINLTDVNESPVVTTSSGNASFTEDLGPVVIDSGLTVSDPENAGLTGAEVRFDSGFVTGQDSLLFTNQAGITGNYNATTGVLTLSGPASLVAYETALRTVRYDNSSHSPNVTNRVIRFTVDDGTNANSATRALTVTPQDDPANVVPGGPYSVAEGGSILLDGSASSDVDSFIVEYAWDFDYDGVTFVADATGDSATFSAASIDGPTTRTLALRTRSDNGAFALATTTVTVTNVAPTANNDSGGAFTTAEDTAFVTGNVLTNDTDPGPETLTVASLDTTGTLGQVIDLGDGTFTYDPNGQFENLALGQSANDTFSYTVTDGVASRVATVTIVITGANDAPIAADQNVAIDENPALNALVATATATDVDAGDSVSWSLSSGNTNGAFSINNVSGEVRVAKPLEINFESNASYSLTVQAADGNGGVDTATIAVSVNDLNETPTANNAVFAVGEDATSGTSVGIITGSDPDAGDTQTWSILSGNTGGEFSLNAATGELSVASPSTLDFETTPTYTLNVQIQDAGGLTDSAVVVVNVSNVNEAPTTTGLSDVAVNEDSADVIIDLKTAFSDAETPSATLSYAIVGNSNPALFNGTPIVGGNLVLKFASNANGNAIVAVRATDPQGEFVTTAFNVVVASVADAPISTPDSYVVSGEQLTVPPAGGVLANDSDPDGDAISALLVSGPANGSLVLLSNGGFTYTPNAGFTGIDTFVYEPFDGTSTGPHRTVVLNVVRAIAPPPPPSAAASSDSGESSDAASTSESDDGEAAEATAETLPATSNATATGPVIEQTEAAVSQDAETEDAEEEVVGTFMFAESGDSFISAESKQLELREATSVSIRALDEVASNRNPSESENRFRDSLRFDGEDLSYLVSTEFIQELEEVEGEFEFDGTVPEWATGTAVATTASISVGYIMWMLRGGYVLASVLSTMPVWQNIDPLPVLAALDDIDDGDDDSLETMIDRASEEADDSETQVVEEATDELRKEGTV